MPASGLRNASLGCAMAAVCSAGAAHAQTGWYIGASGAATRFDAAYDKAVVNAPPSPRAGQTFRDGGSEDAWGAGFGVLAGHRFELAGTLFLSAELDLHTHNPDVAGTLVGRGESPGRNQPGESWPDDWSMERNRSYGLTLKLGGSPPVLASAMGNASLYALAGVRRVKTEFGLAFHGCLEPADCVAEQFTRGTLTRDQDFTAWTLGAGIEKRLAERLAVQGELRFTEYPEEEWLSFNLNGIEVPAELDGDDLELSLRLIWSL